MRLFPFRFAAVRSVRRQVPLLTLAALVLLAACDASARLGAPRTGFSTDAPESALIDPALVGTWRRSLLLGGSGDLLRTETLWTFRADGSATRIVEVVDFGRGIADRFVTHARWRVADGLLVIDWRPPLSGTLLLNYRVSFGGETAVLGRDPYVRVR